MNTFGKWVKDQRFRRDLTQEELAELAGLSTTSISVIEKGKNGHPGTRRKIREALAKVPIPEMSFSFAEDKQPEIGVRS